MASNSSSSVPAFLWGRRFVIRLTFGAARLSRFPAGIRVLFLALSALAWGPTAAFAAETAEAPPSQAWPWEGPFGKFDRPQLQRGYQIYAEVCASCHAMKHLAYRDLEALGYDEGQVKTLAARYEVTDTEPDDFGEYLIRPARPSDKFVSPFPNETAARAANNGAYPVDLSLIVKARFRGSDYVYALLTGYADETATETETVTEAEAAVSADASDGAQSGLYYNRYFPTQSIAMAPPLIEGLVTYADGTTPSVETMSRDVTAFLTWASEPSLELRKKIGFQVMIYLALFLVLAILVQRRVWRRVTPAGQTPAASSPPPPPPPPSSSGPPPPPSPPASS